VRRDFMSQQRKIVHYLFFVINDAHVSLATASHLGQNSRDCLAPEMQAPKANSFATKCGC
jgi:hypothetical protein